MAIQFKIDSDKKFERAINKAIREVDDLRIPFKLITREWFKGNRTIFDPGRQSAGKYKDLSDKYKRTKTRYIGSPYPILVGFMKPAGTAAMRSGKLADSMTDPTNPDSISSIVNNLSLVLGTKAKSKKGAPYPFFLHFGTRKMPARPVVLLGPEQVAPSALNKRKENWIKMIGDYVLQISKGFGD
jgi:hypothetical protein